MEQHKQADRGVESVLGLVSDDHQGTEYQRDQHQAREAIRKRSVRGHLQGRFPGQSPRDQMHPYLRLIYSQKRHKRVVFAENRIDCLVWTAAKQLVWIRPVDVRALRVIRDGTLLASSLLRRPQYQLHLLKPGTDAQLAFSSL